MTYIYIYIYTCVCVYIYIYIYIYVEYMLDIKETSNKQEHNKTQIIVMIMITTISAGRSSQCCLVRRRFTAVSTLREAAPWTESGRLRICLSTLNIYLERKNDNKSTKLQQKQDN